MSVNARRTDQGTDLETAVDQIGDRFYLYLGTDDRGYELRYYPAADAVLIVDDDADVVVDRTALDGQTIHDYRAWVEAEVDATDVDWYDGAFADEVLEDVAIGATTEEVQL